MTSFADFEDRPQSIVLASTNPQPKQKLTYNFDDFIGSLEQTESSGGKFLFNARTGATGPLQVTPIAARDVGEDYNRAKDDHAYARGVGVKYARKLWDQFEGVPELVAAAYHTGPTAVKRWIGEAQKYGSDPITYVQNKLGKEGAGHNTKVMKGLKGIPVEPEKKEETRFDVETGTFTSRDESSPRGAVPGREPVTFDSFGKPGLRQPKGPVASFLSQLAGEGGAIADLILSLPGFTVGVGAGLGATTMGLATGESPQTAYQSGRKIGHKVTEALSNPVQKLFNLFDSGEVYEQTKTVEGMSKLTELIDNADQYWSQKTKGKVPPGSFGQLVDTMMAASVGAKSAVTQARQAANKPAAKTFRDFSDVELSDPAAADAFVKSVLEDAAKQEARRKLALVAGGGAAAGGVAYGVDQYLRNRKPEQKEPEPQPTETGTFLAESDPNFASLAPALLAAGAVKGKGGMWHPEAVKRLSDPLVKGLSRGIEPELLQQARDNPQSLLGGDAKAFPEIQHSDRMIRNYLNKYAGTEGDPLANVEIPFGEGTRKWGELWDKTIEQHPASYYQGFEEGKGLEKAHPDENISNWGRGNQRPVANGAITNYLSHVGDYLRQHYKPGELKPIQWAETIAPEKVKKSLQPFFEELNKVGTDPQAYSDVTNRFEAAIAKEPSWQAYKNPLAQVDLVRAVKETAANDARVAKEMEKVAQASMKDLPVYKEYPDGFKWVELKLSDKDLTPEQMTGVRKATKEELVQLNDRSYVPDETYVAIDHTGKPIRNSYTNDFAFGKSAKEARLAGQLAQEGNQMGHCVGGYCEGVASGESRIFSLRDAKGKSHVTVETAPGGMMIRNLNDFLDYHLTPRLEAELKATGIPQNQWGSRASTTIKNSPEYAEFIRARDAGEFPSSIIQIKGKQNRAPNKEYLPYVQDFVRSGKWGEVGDLNNAGLRDLKAIKHYQKDYPQSYANLETKFPGERFFTDEQLKDAEAPQGPRNQRGEIDFRVAGVLAAGGVGAALLYNYLNNSESLSNDIGMALGAAGTLGTRGKIAKGIKEVATLADTALGRSSTRIANINPELARKVRDMEHQGTVSVAEASSKIESFIKETKKLPKEELAALDHAYMSSDVAALNSILRKHPTLDKAYMQVRGWLNNTQQILMDFGRFRKGIQEYLPKVVKDYEGLLESLGKVEKASIERLVSEANIKSLKSRGRELSEIERSIIVNRWLAGDESMSHLPGYAKNRKIKNPEKHRQYYASLEESLVKYGHAASEDIAMTRFFGNDLRTSKQGDKKYTNVEDSIGALTNRLLTNKEITAAQAVELQEILRARFGGGTKAPHWALQDARNVTGALTLGQLGSGVLQVTESILSMYHHGVVPTLRSIGTMLSGKSISPKEFGLANHVIEEVINKRPTGQVLSGILKLNMLAMLDQLGMRTNLNASFHKNQALARTKAGMETLREKWGDTYGIDFNQLVKELQSSKIDKRSPLVESLLWAELSDIRPTSRIENTQVFNANPNARLLYQLKQFMLTQADIIRRDAYNKIKTGDPKQIAIGLKNLTTYATAMGVSLIPVNAIKDWLSGRDYDIEDENILLNFAQNFGLSKYTADRIERSKTPVKAAVEGIESVLKPPVFSVAENLAHGVSDPKKLVSMIPFSGRIATDRAFGGNEKIKERKLQDGRSELYKIYESGNMDEFERKLNRLAGEHELTHQQVKSIRTNAKLPKDVRQFKGLTIQQQDDKLKELSPEQRERFQPHAKKKLRSKVYE